MVHRQLYNPIKYFIRRMKASNKNKNAKRGVKRTFPATKDTEAGIEDPLLNDARFRDATWDPKFSKVPKRAKGAIEDERFVSKLKNDSSFREKFTPVDRFGRPKQQAKLDLSLKRLAPSDDDDDDDGDDGDDDEIRPNVMQKFKGMDDEDDEDEDDDDMSDMKDYIEDANEELEHIPRGNATKRLAIIGLDWSVTRAVDILASLGSFCPTGKRIQSVEVHPSKFGLERLAAEAKFGPQVIAKEDLRVVREEKNKSKIKQIQAENNDDLLSDDEQENYDHHEPENEEEEEEEDDDDDGVDENDVKSWKQQAALRRYEEERLKYYYAVVEFEDVKSADAVYEQCDGVEYAQSGRAFDLRFILDEMAIETTPRECATSVPDGYKPPNVNLSSLNNSTVKLSWDADPPDRVVLKKKAFGKNDMMEADLKAYLASSSEDEGDSENDGENEGNTRKKMSQDDIQKRRNLLLGIDDGKNKKSDDADDDVDLEVTFEPGMLEKAEEILKRKQEKEELKHETEWETRLRRIRERKNEKRKQRRELMASKNYPGDDEDEAGDDFSEEEGDEDDDVDNPTFLDPFFSVERDFDEEEKKSVAKAKAKEAETNKSDKRKAKGKARSNDGDEDHNDDSDGDDQRRQAQLELLAMDVGLKKNNDKLKQTLAAADSDDEEDKRRNGKRGKRTRGKRRSQKADKGEDGHRVEKPSVVDMDDERFQNVFNSHLFAIDPTHSKYRDNDTTRNIIKEKGRRSHNRTPVSASATSVGENVTEPSRGQPGAKASETTEPRNSAQAELNRLAARVKARAKAKQKAQ